MSAFRHYLLIAAVATTAISVQAATAQSDSTQIADTSCHKPKPTRSYCLVQTGVIEVDPDKLNDKLSSQGIAVFDAHTLSVSIGGHSEFKRLISEGQFSVALWRKNDNLVSSSLMLYNFSQNVGFNVLPPDLMVSLFPSAGFGMGVNKLHIHSKSVSLSDVLTSTIPDRTLRQGTLFFNAGIGSDVTLPSKDGSRGFVIGLRGGVQLPLYESKWRSSGTIISDVPDLKQKGIYARIVIGGWDNNYDKTGPKKDFCKSSACSSEQ